MTDCVTLWIGERLGAVENACLKSILRQGHRVSLYCYETPANVPAGVRLRDASEILPESAAFRHDAGSVGHFSDWFRYELQQRSLGTWVDTDVYLLKPLDGVQPNLFGEQSPGVINNAVLRMTVDSPVLAELLRPFTDRTVPEWLPFRTRTLARMRGLVTGEVDFGRLPWGSTGPHALTELARKFGLTSQALPSDTFYPVRWQDAGWIVDPMRSLEDMITERTVAIHLWNECIRGFKDRPAPEGSFLHRLQQEAGS
jgi:hypothetical protein